MRNYKITSLGSNSSVKSIIAVMNSSAGIDDNKLKPKEEEVLRIVEDKKDLVSATVRVKSRKSANDVSKSIVVVDGSSTARHSIMSTEDDDVAKTATVVVVDKKDVKKRAESTTGLIKVQNGNAKECENSGHSKSNNEMVVVKGSNGRAEPAAQCPASSSEDDSDEDDETEMSSAEESSDELDSTSSSEEEDDDNKTNGGGLEPISEEHSLRIDPSEVGNSKRQSKVKPDQDFDDAEEAEEDDDGNNNNRI